MLRLILLSLFQITPGSKGLPVNVQCAGLPFQEQLVLSLMLLFVFQITPGSKGLPINVQCAGLPFQEELVLRHVVVYFPDHSRQ